MLKLAVNLLQICCLLKTNHSRLKYSRFFYSIFQSLGLKTKLHIYISQ